MLQRSQMKATLLFGLCLISFSASAENSMNIAHNKLVALPKDQQAIALGGITGENCAGTKAFFMGLGKDPQIKDYAFWSVRCSNGKSYMIEILPDAAGSTKILECSVAAYFHAGPCFKKF